MIYNKESFESLQPGDLLILNNDAYYQLETHGVFLYLDIQSETPLSNLRIGVKKGCIVTYVGQSHHPANHLRRIEYLSVLYENKIMYILITESNFRGFEKC